MHLCYERHTGRDVILHVANGLRQEQPVGRPTLRLESSLLPLGAVLILSIRTVKVYTKK